MAAARNFVTWRAASAVTVLVSCATLPSQRRTPASLCGIPGAGADTVRGIIARSGSEPATSLLLRATTDDDGVALVGLSRSLSSVDGLEVCIAGERTTTAREFHVSAFVVRAANGVQAVDGTLRSKGDTLLLVVVNGPAIVISRAPARLRTYVGSRVWIAGPLDREPQMFGRIEPDSR